MRFALISVGRVVAASSALVLLCLLTPLFVPGSALGGVIQPAFNEYLDTLSPDEMVSVMIMLEDQVALASMDVDLRAADATRLSRHTQVITALRDKASLTQGALLSDLALRRVGGEVDGFTPHWIANLVIARLTVDAVREVATRSDVGMIYADFTVSSMEPIGGVPAPPQPEEAGGGIGVTPGIRAIQADRVWHELGITGAGAIVCGLDTGVLGSHVALAESWRGNSAPASEAWLDALGSSSFPSDGHGHGTHTMGTMVGMSSATGDTVGVAWGAEWMACNAIDQGVGSVFDNDVIAAFEWMADPDGNPGTVNDVPDVVQNSWRINEGFGGDYIDCDPRWWAAMDALEVAGCAVVFSAGNEGPGPQTIGSPPDRITSPTNAYSIGALSATEGQTFPYAAASFSSRGPSGCDNQTIKPEVSAPGVEVYSTVNSGGYQASGWSGTSMAGPHVSGIIALMREANPNVDVTTMKQIIMDTAIDLGASGEDNTFGWGIPDAFEAVSAVMEGLGEISGTVTHAALGVPISGASISVDGRTFTTNPNGDYVGFVSVGTHNVTADHPAFEADQAVGVDVLEGAPAIVDFQLTAAPDGVAPVITDVTCLFATDDTAGPYTIGATVTDNLGFLVVDLEYDLSGGLISAPMTPLGNDRYEATIPGQPIGTTVRYSIEATDAALNETNDPFGAPGTQRSFVVALAAVALTDDVESDLGWTLGVPGDNATTGLWVRADPVGTTGGSTGIYQPEDDHTPDPGVTCFITGNGAPGGGGGDNDVDGGCTTLLSPLFDVAGAHEAIVSYWRWYTNETALDDEFVVDISSDGGSTWQPLERVPGTTQPWTRVELSLRCQIDLTDQMRLRFIACDQGTPSLTEAGIDDVFIGRFDLEPAAIANSQAVPIGRFRLIGAQPNPFNPSTLVQYEVATRGAVQLRLYDVQGRLVRALVDDVVEAGVHSLQFDGRNTGGAPLSSGTYFLRLEANGRRATEKLSLVR